MAWLRLQDGVLQNAAGALLVGSGALALLAWWLPSFDPSQIAATLAPNAAFAFVLLGLGLIEPRPRISGPMAALTASIAMLVLSQYLFELDLPLERFIAHVWLNSAAEHPGRMSPQTATCFLIGATALLLWHTRFATRVAMLAQILALSLTAFALVSLLGYCFDLEMLYRWDSHPRMSPYAAALFTPTGVALWLRWYQRALDAGRYAGREDERIKLITSSLIVLVTSIAGASGFILLAADSEEGSRAALIQRLSERTRHVELELDERLRDSEALAAQLQSMEGAALARRTALQFFLRDDITAIRWVPADGPSLSVGSFQQNPAQVLTLDQGTRLAWQERATLQVERVLDEGEVRGHLLVESRLPVLTGLLAARGTPPAVTFVCTASDTRPHCLPYDIDRSSANARAYTSLQEAVRLALTGDQGMAGLVKEPGEALVVAHAPARHGLALVLQEATSDVYADLRQSRLALAIVLLFVIAVGILLLRSQLTPLARQANEARAAAAESVTRTEAIMNSVADGIVTIDSGGTIVAANRALYRMFGYEGRELLGRAIDSLIPQGLQAARELGWSRYVRQAAARPGENSLDVMGRRHDGMTFAAQLTLTPMQLGETAYLVGNVRDVTLARVAEAQLRRANERFKLATQAARLGVFEWDLTSGVLIWDALVHELHGIPIDATPTYDTWRRLVHPDDLPRVEQEVDEAITVGRDISFDFRIVQPDCSERVLRTAATIARDERGTPMRVTGVTWDVTETRRLDRMKSEFVSVVSHELRTPLTSIRGALGLIAGTATSLPDKTQHLLEIAYRNTDRLGLLISDILDVEKIESGGLAFTNEQVNIRDLVTQAIESNQAYAIERGVRLQLVTSNEDLFVLADANRLLQVMANLLSNAAKFSPAGAPVDIAILTLSNAVRVSVRDYGPGIPEAFQHRVFHKFAQADASDTRAKGGTGLGLAISKAIIERLGGRIGYDSAPGVGTLFYFDLPLAGDLSQSGVWRHRAPQLEA